MGSRSTSCSLRGDKRDIGDLTGVKPVAYSRISSPAVYCFNDYKSQGLD
jgi:hypothetical protein